jgi:hypothetical protein
MTHDDSGERLYKRVLQAKEAHLRAKWQAL